MVKLTYVGNNKHVARAVSKANSILADPGFYRAVEQFPQLDNTELSSEQIARAMFEANQEICIDTYWRPWGRAHAIIVEVDKIYLNTAKVGSTLGEAVNTLIHETVYAVDFLDGTLAFTCFDYSPNGKANTAPWQIGALAEKMVEPG